MISDHTLLLNPGLLETDTGAEKTHTLLLLIHTEAQTYALHVCTHTQESITLMCINAVTASFAKAFENCKCCLSVSRMVSLLVYKKGAFTMLSCAFISFTVKQIILYNERETSSYRHSI